ncbi:MAG: DNA polymerase III subunit delta [Candidatus Sacchiramonaceae bacterium]|nr:DNA polymerase III subunit delta [Candidatus Saccharimonadaceae bacterium]
MDNLSSKAVVLYGENSFERARELAKLSKLAKKDGFDIERIDGENLASSDMVSLVSGISLLSEKRFIVVKNLSLNAGVWAVLDEFISKISSDIILVIIEDKLDKRTKAFKAISKIADMREFKVLTPKDAGLLAETARGIAKVNGESMTLKDAKFLVNWVGVSEWKVKSAIDRLAIIGDLSEAAIKKYVPQTLENNVFGLFEAAINRRIDFIITSLEPMRHNNSLDEAYQLFGLISTQFFNLAALKLGSFEGRSVADISDDIGVKTWGLSQLQGLKNQCSNEDIMKISKILARADDNIKKSSGAIWDFVESVLLEIAAR